MKKEHLIRTLEVTVKKNIGSERLFRDYLLLRVERMIYDFSVDQYTRILRALADKHYVEDKTFWD